MMYSEFLELSGKSENYITLPEYSTWIEPIYMKSDVDKNEFVKHFENVFQRVVYPAVEQKIKSYSMETKEQMAFQDPTSHNLFVDVEKVDAAARKVAYNLLEIELTI